MYAAEKAGEVFSDCGSAVVKSPQPGVIYTLALNGEELAALTHTMADRDAEIKSPALTIQED
jgi:hypothetical protein